MKKVIFLLMFACFWVASFAQPGASLTVFSSNNQRFWLFVDDVLQNQNSVSSILIYGMQFRQYKIRVEIDNINLNCVGQLINISNHQNGNNYSISGRNNSFTINKTQSHVRPALTQNLIVSDYNYYDNYNNRPHGGGNTHGTYPQRPPGPGHQGFICRNQSEFSSAMNALKNENFEAGKLQFAKSMTQSGPICVEQIIQICNVFVHEATKLEYAKFAYNYCTDKNLYYMVNTVFSHQSSKNELNDFIR